MFQPHDLYLVAIQEMFFRILFWSGFGVFALIALVQLVIFLRGEK